MKEIDNTSLNRWDDKQSPFRVPDGYFDTLAARVMENIPDEVHTVQPRARKTIMRPWLRWAAVSLATIGIGLGAFLLADRNGSGVMPNHAVMPSQTAMTSADENLDEMADYMMLDQEDLYAYLSAE